MMGLSVQPCTLQSVVEEFELGKSTRDSGDLRMGFVIGTPVFLLTPAAQSGSDNYTMHFNSFSIGHIYVCKGHPATRAYCDLY